MTSLWLCDCLFFQENPLQPRINLVISTEGVMGLQTCPN
jgi:hypothetical protein